MSIEHTLKKIGLAKNTKQAQIIMIGIIIISTFFAIQTVTKRESEVPFDETILSPQEQLLLQNSEF